MKCGGGDNQGTTVNKLSYINLRYEDMHHDVDHKEYHECGEVKNYIKRDETRGIERDFVYRSVQQ